MHKQPALVTKMHGHKYWEDSSSVLSDILEYSHWPET